MPWRRLRWILQPPGVASLAAGEGGGDAASVMEVGFCVMATEWFLGHLGHVARGHVARAHMAHMPWQACYACVHHGAQELLHMPNFGSIANWDVYNLKKSSEAQYL